MKGNNEEMAIVPISDINVAANTNVEWEVRLPDALDGHNLLKINETHLVLVDGYPPNSKRVWLHQLGTEVKNDLFKKK